MTPLASVRQAARKAACARQDLVDAIRAGKATGASLRALAEASGMSHEHVRRLLRD